MTVVTRTVHRHECATCNGEFIRRKYQSGEPCEFCVCSDWDAPFEGQRVELCDTCRKAIGEAGFVGALVMRMLERLIACECTIDAFERITAPATGGAP